MRTFLFSVCAGSLLVGAAMAQTTSQPAAPPAEAATPAPVQCVGAEGVVYFDLGSTALNAESEASLRDVANARRDGCTSQITLTGHTDATGSVARNRQLAQQRAEVVKRQLVSLGVPQEAARRTSNLRRTRAVRVTVLQSCSRRCAPPGWVDPRSGWTEVKTV
jgi:outer membrane protein OmpA-like peptidoglycan-associated protein